MPLWTRLMIAMTLLVCGASCTKKDSQPPAAPIPAATSTFTSPSTPGSPTATPTPTRSATPTETRTPTMSSTQTSSPSDTPTAAASPTRTATGTPTFTLSPTESPTGTLADTATFTDTPTPDGTPVSSPTVNCTPPPSTVRFLFIHHSTGCNWLVSGNGGLGDALEASHYFVSEAYYGWSDPPSPPAQWDVTGDHTDTFDWPGWFNDDVMPYVYAEDQGSCYTASLSNPGGGNEVILAKSCFPNSEVGDDISDEQALYQSLLPYFLAHPDKMFVICVPPPMQVISHPALTRQLADWMVDPSGWLSSYAGGNVFVFDLYNVLTGPENHHRVHNGTVEHVVTGGDVLYYPSSDDHPSQAGNQKATMEFVPLLNAWYRQWKGLP